MSYEEAVKVIRRLEQENEKLEREKEELTEENKTLRTDKYTCKTLLSEISQHIGNKPSSSTYKYFRAKLDGIGIKEGE